MINSIKLVLFMLLMISNQVKALDVNINSNQDGIAYIKASYVLAQKKSCNITAQQKKDYLNSISFPIKAQEENLIEKTLELSDLLCPSLISVFNNLIEIENQVFNHYPITKLDDIETLNVRKKVIKSPEGDMAILNLGTASMVCASVRDVNPDAIKGNSKSFFSDSVKLYSYFHSFSLDRSRENQMGFYNRLTGEPAIKEQSLNSISGAKNYVSKYLTKTDANTCNEIHAKANYILSKYELQL